MTLVAIRHSAPSPAPYRYRIFGLTIASDFELFGLPEGGFDDDCVEIVRSSLSYPLPAEASAPVFENRGDEQIIAWSMVGVFRIVSDTRIEVDPIPGATDRLVALPLLGTVLATLLHRRGLYVLHASAISVGGRAVALLGDKGAGKSTTAAAMLAAGHSLLADDVVALNFSAPGGPAILPAFAQLKLWSDASVGLAGLDLTDYGPLYGDLDKSSFGITRAFATAASPASRFYVLTRSENPGVATLPAEDAHMALLRYSYMARFGDAGFGSGIASHFLRSGEIARSGMVRLLRAPSGLDRIGEIPSLVSADLENQA